MKKSSNGRTSWRHALTLVVFALALAASVVLPASVADASPSDRSRTIGTDTTAAGLPGDDPDVIFCLSYASDVDECMLLHGDPGTSSADMDPWTWFCLVEVPAKDFKACENGWVEDPDRATLDTSKRLSVATKGGNGPGDNGGPGDNAPDDMINCPDGYYPIQHNMPIYDEDGLFVIGHQLVWICVDADAEPAG